MLLDDAQGKYKNAPKLCQRNERLPWTDVYDRREICADDAADSGEKMMGWPEAMCICAPILLVGFCIWCLSK